MSVIAMLIFEPGFRHTFSAQVEVVSLNLACREFSAPTTFDRLIVFTETRFHPSSLSSSFSSPCISMHAARAFSSVA